MSPVSVGETGFSETRRQIVHMTMGVFALLLRVLTWWQAAACAAAALAFNLLLLPRLGGRALYRPVDAARGYPVGIVVYPLVVLVLSLALPRRLDIVAAAWGMMAVGDGAATLIGRHSRGPRLPWNRDKSVEGTAAFILLGSAAAILLAWWTRPAVHPAPHLLFVIGAPVVAGIVAGLVETIPVRLDDNISVPVSTAAVLWGLSLITRDAAVAGWPGVSAILLAAAVNAIVATLGWRARTVSTAGAVAGAGIGFVVFACAGLAGWLLLFASFLAAAITSRMGLQRKALLGIAEEREGRRGPGNALANCGVAAFAAILAILTPYHVVAMLAFVTALTAGASDTVASEIGKAWGRWTFLVPTFARVKPGTPGAISMEGTAAGLVAALALVALSLALQLMPPHLFWFAVVGATVGSLAESWLGATLEGPGVLDNDLLNFLNTAIGAVTAIVLMKALS